MGNRIFMTSTWFSQVGKSHPGKYVLVVSGFLVASALRETGFDLPLATLTLFLALLMRINPADLVILGIPFHFTILSPIRATASIAHVALPMALVYTFLIRRRATRIPKNLRTVAFGLVSLPAIVFLTSAISGVLAGSSGLTWLALAKLSLSVLIGVWTFVMLKSTHDEQEITCLLAKLWVLLALVVGVLALLTNIYARVLDASTPFAYGGSRLMGTFENPNSFALHLLLSSLISLWLSFQTLQRRYLLIAISLGIFSVMSQSTSGMLALLTCGLLAFALSIFHPSIRRNTIAFGIGSMMSLPVSTLYSESIKQVVEQSRGQAVAVHSDNVLERVGSTSYVVAEVNKVASDVRWSIWAEALTFFRGNPWLGIGYGNFLERSEYGLLIHNSPLRVLVEGGLVSFALFAGLTVLVVRRAFRSGPALLSLSLILPGAIIFGLGSNILHSPSVWASLGLLLSVLWREAPRTDPSPRNG